MARYFKRDNKGRFAEKPVADKPTANVDLSLLDVVEPDDGHNEFKYENWPGDAKRMATELFTPPYKDLFSSARKKAEKQLERLVQDAFPDQELSYQKIRSEFIRRREEQQREAQAVEQQRAEERRREEQQREEQQRAEERRREEQQREANKQRQRRAELLDMEILQVEQQREANKQWQREAQEQERRYQERQQSLRQDTGKYYGPIDELELDGKVRLIVQNWIEADDQHTEDLYYLPYREAKKAAWKAVKEAFPEHDLDVWFMGSFKKKLREAEKVAQRADRREAQAEESAKLREEQAEESAKLREEHDGNERRQSAAFEEYQAALVVSSQTKRFSKDRETARQRVKETAQRHKEMKRRTSITALVVKKPSKSNILLYNQMKERTKDESSDV